MPKLDKVKLMQSENETCNGTGYQPLTVCVPVTVTPFVNELPTTTFCCGDPIITSGVSTCGGIENGSCTFTITQNICVVVPVEFGATPVVDDPFVQCQMATDIDICTECGTDERGRIFVEEDYNVTN